MKTQPITQDETAPNADQLSETCETWSVLFDTNGGMTHPIRYSKRGSLLTRAEVQEAANKYLREHSDWLVAISQIIPRPPTP